MPKPRKPSPARFDRGVLIAAFFFLVAPLAMPNAWSQTVVIGRANFLAAVPFQTTLGFDQFAPGTTLTGAEYAALGVTFQHLNGQAINVASWSTTAPGLVIPSGPNAISSSYASVARAGYVAACCGIYFNNANADRLRFNFAPGVRSAGIHLGENDYRGVTVRWLDAAGQVIASQAFAAGAPANDVVGLTGSTTPIAAMEVTNEANDGDGVFFDDLLFETIPATRAGPVGFISNTVANTVSVVDLASNQVTSTIPVCAQPGPVSLAPDGNHVYVFCYKGSIAAIDTRTFAVVTRPLGLQYIHGIEVRPDGRYVYVTGGLNAMVWVVDAATLGMATSFAVNNSPAGALDNHIGLTFDASGSRLYVTQCGYACGLSTVTVVDTSTHTIAGQIPLGATGPAYLVRDDDGAFLYVTEQGRMGTGNTVGVIDMALNQEVASIPVGLAPYGIALDSPRRRLYVTNYYSNTVSVIDTATRSVVATIPVGVAPSAAAVTSDGRMVVVTNYGSHTISLINTATNTVTATVPVGVSPMSTGNGGFVTREPFAAAPTALTVSDASATYGGTVTLSATLTSEGLAVAARTISFALGGVTAGSATTDASGVATLTGASVAAFAAGVHADAVVAGFGGDLAYGARQARADLTLAQASPGLAWTSPPAITYGTPLGAAQLCATAAVPGTFGYTPPAGTLLSAGTHTLSVTFTPSDGNFATASTSVILTVTKAVPAINWPQPATLVYGTPLGAAQLNASSPVPGVFTFSPSAGTVFEAGTRTLFVSFAPANTANYTSTTATVSLVVQPAPSSLSLHASAMMVAVGEPAVFSATLNVPFANLSVPTVQFFDGATTLGTANVVWNNGVATATITRAFSSMAGIPHFVTARFAGSASVLASASDPVAVAVSPARFSYAVIDLGTLGGYWSTAEDVNNARQVVGTSPIASGAFRAFLYESSTMRDLGTLGGPSSRAEAINELGHVVGTADTAGNAGSHAFVWRGGVMTDLGTLGGATSWATDINDAGDVVGHSTVAMGSSVTHGFLYRDGQMFDLGTLGGTNSQAVGVDAQGRVVVNSDTPGNATYTRRTFVWDNGVRTDIGSLGGTFTSATGVNPDGGIVGETTIAGGFTHAFLHTNGSFTDLGPILEGIRPRAVNGHQQIAGFNQWLALGDQRATVLHGGTIVDPNALVASSPFAVLRDANGINDQGVMVGYGDLPGSNFQRAYLLSPQAQTELSLDPVTTAYGSVGTLVARLSAGAPLAGRQVSFSVADVVVGQTVTDDAGAAYFPVAMAPGGVGTYGVAASFSGDLTGTPSSALANWVVMPATPTIDVSPDRITYDGHPHAVSATVTGVLGDALGTASVTYRRVTAAGEEQPPAVETPPTEAGEYDVVASSVAGFPNYEPLTLNHRLVIEKATPAVSLGSATFTYDGQPHPVLASVAGALGEDLGVVTIDYSPGGAPPVDAGDYHVTVAYAGSNNYLPATGTVTLTITRATPTITVTGGDFAYDGRPHPVVVSLTGVRGDAIDGITADYTPGRADVPVDAGWYTAVVSFPGNLNYEPVDRHGSIVITRATPTVVITGGTFGYDGRPHGANATATGVQGEDLGAVAIEYAPGEVEPSDAGTYTATATFAGSANYATASQSATVVIQPGAPTILLAGGTYAYDGQSHPTAGTVTGGNGESLGALTFTYNGSPEWPVNAGTYAVIGSFTGSANYEAASATTMVQIAQVPIVVSAVSATKVYGQPNPPFAVSVDGLVNGETVTVLSGTPSFTTDATATSAVGAYPVMPAGVTALNYQMGFAAGVLTITQAGSQVAVSSSSNPAGYLQPIALRADVTPTPLGSGAATGTVEFLDGTAVIGSASVAAGAATINIVLEPGTHAITARYLGGPDVGAGEATLSQTVNPRNESSSTSLRIRSTQSQVGDEVTLDISVTVASGTPTGVVHLLDGDAVVAILPLSSGRASYSTTALAVGAHTFVARYPGDGTTTASASTPVVHTVVDGAKLERSAVRLSVPRRSQATDAINAEVIVSGTGPTPTGAVTLYLDGGLVGELPLSAQGASDAAAVFVLPPQAIGSHLLTAIYGGSETHAGSTGEVQLRIAK